MKVLNFIKSDQKSQPQGQPSFEPSFLRVCIGIYGHVGSSCYIRNTIFIQ